MENCNVNAEGSQVKVDDKVLTEEEMNKAFGLDEDELAVEVEPDPALDELLHNRIILSLTTYAKFLALIKTDPAWTDCLVLYLHLFYTARLQKTNSVWANRSYLMRGLRFGTEKVKKCIRLLEAENFISLRGQVDPQTGKKKQPKPGCFAKTYIVLRHIPRSPKPTADLPQVNGKTEEKGGPLTCLPSTVGGSTKCLKHLKKKDSHNESPASPEEGADGPSSAPALQQQEGGILPREEASKKLLDILDYLDERERERMKPIVERERELQEKVARMKKDAERLIAEEQRAKECENGKDTSGSGRGGLSLVSQAVLSA